MTIRWTHPAVEDLEAVYDYIARDNKEKAARVIAELLLAVDAVEIFPQMGQTDPLVPGRRTLTHPPVASTIEFIKTPSKYLTCYTVAAGTIN